MWCVSSELPAHLTVKGKHLEVRRPGADKPHTRTAAASGDAVTDTVTDRDRDTVRDRDTESAEEEGEEEEGGVEEQLSAAEGFLLQAGFTVTRSILFCSILCFVVSCALLCSVVLCCVALQLLRRVAMLVLTSVYVYVCVCAAE
jgi:hypothetical protein